MAAFVLAIVALTPDAPWWLRIVCGAGAAVGTYLSVDAVVFGRSWRLSERALHVPTLAARRREIAGDGLTVELTAGRRPVLRLTGPRGSRLVGVNPLVAGRDLRRWFDALPDS